MRTAFVKDRRSVHARSREVFGADDPSFGGDEDLLERAWDENANPFSRTRCSRRSSALRKRLGEPWLIATVRRRLSHRHGGLPDAGR